MLRKTSLAVILLLNVCAAFSQFRLENWKAYTSFNNVMDAAQDSKGRIWAATRGGVFVYDPETVKFRTFTNTDGPIALEALTIAPDAERKEIIVGYADGIIEIATEEFEWKHITDIKYSGVTNPSINNIIIHGDYIYAAAGFGIAIIDRSKKIFIEDIRKLGSFPSDMNIKQIFIFKDKIWAATEEGLAVAPNKVGSLRNPNVWKNYSAPLHLSEDAVRGIAEVNDSLFIATDRAVYKYMPELDSFLLVVKTPSNLPSDEIKSLAAVNNDLFYLTEMQAKNISNFPVFSEWSGLNKLVAFNISGIDTVAGITRSRGIAFKYNDSLIYLAPNSPSTNAFSSITISNEGDIWASGKSNMGIDVYSGNKWLNLDKDRNPELNARGFHKLNTGKSGKIYASSWGGGVSIIEKNGGSFLIKNYNSTNAPFKGLDDSPDYIVIGDVVEDNKGDAWIVNWGARLAGPVLVNLNEEGNFTSFTNCNGPTRRTFLAMDIDGQGTKWMGAGFDTPEGILFYNDMGTLANTSDDVCGVVSTAGYQALQNNQVTAIAADLQGTIWAGTTEGLSQILNPHAALGSSPKFIVRKINFNEIKSVNDIYVDALDNKWIATSKGVFVLNPDASELIGEVNMDNSPLPSNEVMTISGYPPTGAIFFATSKGIFEASSLSAMPLQEYDAKCYPQPFNPERDKELVIDGLAPNTELRIVTTTGRLIRSLETTGRKTIWDGRDTNGDYPGSGVYIILLTSSSVESRAVAKFAIVRD